MPSEMPMPFVEESDYGNSNDVVDSEKWAEDLERVIRRSYISDALESGASLDETKKMVRKLEEENRVGEIVEGLVTNETNVHPRIEAVANELHTQLAEQFPEVQAVVVFGSAVSGGAMLREALGEHPVHDLDWGLVYDRRVSSDRRDEIGKVANDLVIAAGEAGAFEGLESCPQLNPENVAFMSLENEAEAEMLLSEFMFGSHEAIGSVMSCFLPSFPPEVNEQNREHLTAALSNIRQRDVEEWEAIVDTILDEWTMVHGIEDKHVRTSGGSRDQELLEGVALDAPDVMKTPLERNLKE